MSVKNHDIVLTLQPGEQQIETSQGQRFSKIIQSVGKPLGFSCGGRGVCTACVIYVRGEASPISPREAQLLANVEPLDPEWKPRIACLARVSGSVEVRTTYW